MNLEKIIREYVEIVTGTWEFRITAYAQHQSGDITFGIRYRRKNIVFKPPKYCEIIHVYFGTNSIGYKTHSDFLYYIIQIIKEDERRNNKAKVRKRRQPSNIYSRSKRYVPNQLRLY